MSLGAVPRLPVMRAQETELRTPRNNSYKEGILNGGQRQLQSVYNLKKIAKGLSKKVQSTPLNGTNDQEEDDLNNGHFSDDELLTPAEIS